MPLWLNSNCRPIAERSLDIPHPLPRDYRERLYAHITQRQPRTVVMYNHGIGDGAELIVDRAWPTDLIAIERFLRPPSLRPLRRLAQHRFPRRIRAMQATIELDCPEELLLGLHVSAEEFRDEVKLRAAVALFREGRVSSGLAARWLKMPRVKFLLLAMQDGGEFLADTQDDFKRELALL